MRRRKLTIGGAPGPLPDFAEVAVETEAQGLSPGVRVRWFRSNVARLMVDGAEVGSVVPPGAIVWGEEGASFPVAAAVTPVPGPEEGPHAPSEPAVGVGPVPTVREAVEGALAALPADVREGAVTRDAAVLDERARLARDLHDVVAHHVSLIAVRAETAPYSVTDLGAGGRQVLADIAEDARRALDELRGVLGVLRRASDDPALAPQPTAADIPALVARAAASGEQVRWTHEPDGLDTIPPPIGYAGYRVVQEALTNARRHAPGRPVEVTCRPGGRGMWLRVVTDVGRPLGSPAPGRGLTGARERVEALEGRFAAGPVADSFVVEAEIPAGARG